VLVNGFSDLTSVPIQYSIAGKVATVYIPAMTGTSSNTTYSLANLPAAILSSIARQRCFALVLDNAIETIGQVLTPLNNTAPEKRFTFQIGGSGTAFTSSGNKGLSSAICLTYLL
jgi:hypothetical protein